MEPEEINEIKLVVRPASTFATDSPYHIKPRILKDVYIGASQNVSAFKRPRIEAWRPSATLKFLGFRASGCCGFKQGVCGVGFWVFLFLRRWGSGFGEYLESVYRSWAGQSSENS